ncbi:MAG TPA: hypothetical protein VH115_02700 [Solirubrobacteraceae bacterium]|jgi:hypothetical protein|nr:hypothetical protein [Solirubrobacteraceae bacterium]
MPARTERPAFYAVGAGRIGDVVALLHPPYTAWHLSYFALGAAAAPHVYASRVAWGLGAFALAVGVGAHALDELHDRPLGTRLSDRVLLGLALASATGALAIGVGGILVVTAWLAPFVAAGALFLPAYNLELLHGRFHSDAWFAVGWGAFPALTGYFVNARSISLTAVFVAAGCYAMSVAQRSLSTPARELRRRTVAVRGERERGDGTREPITRESMLAPLDGALGAMSVAIVVLAASLLAARI